MKAHRTCSQAVLVTAGLCFLLPGVSLAATLSDAGQCSGPVNASVQAILAGPGGSTMAEAIANTVAQDYGLAQDVICSMKGVEGSLNFDVGDGLAGAQLILGRKGSGEEADQVGRWMQHADATLQGAYFNSRTTGLAQGGWPRRSTFSSTGGVVSPSQP